MYGFLVGVFDICHFLVWFLGIISEWEFIIKNYKIILLLFKVNTNNHEQVLWDRIRHLTSNWYKARDLFRGVSVRLAERLGSFAFLMSSFVSSCFYNEDLLSSFLFVFSSLLVNSSSFILEKKNYVFDFGTHCPIVEARLLMS